jgi:hypothetical protein
MGIWVYEYTRTLVTYATKKFVDMNGEVSTDIVRLHNVSLLPQRRQIEGVGYRRIEW